MSYLPTGEMSATSGSRTYPVQYSYDAAGRMKTLVAGTGTTTWNYDPASGFLASKLYADGKGPSYSYTPAGRLASRTWARGITTTYTQNGAGEVASVAYSDSTPSVNSTYDRLSRRTLVSCGSQLAAYSYNDAGQLLAENWTGSPLDGLVISNSYDALLRRSSLAAAISPSSLLTSHSFSYDSASRLSSVTSGSSVAQYGYLPNSFLVDTLTFTQGGTTRMTTTKQYDGLNRLTSVSSVASGLLPVASFSYTLNNANQRTQSTLADGSRWDYTYDALGQVTGGSKKWADGTPVGGEQFGYAFDSIGNRTSTTVNGRMASYVANNLNQYTQRDVPGAFDVLGSAATNAAVTVNGQSASRHGESFATTLSLTNNVGPVFQDVKVYGLVKNAGPNGEDVFDDRSGKAILPQTPELFTVDADGNLVTNGRWTHTWDAENRLTTVTALVSIPDGVKVKVEYTYDDQWRMIRRKQYTWNASTSAYGLQSSVSFLYDGWHLIAEMDGSGNLLRSYQWGTDLSSSMGGAGGVGGLLSVKDVASNVTYFYCHDGNGNVSALVNAETGQVAAQYEYDAFGNLIRATGPMAQVNPIRWSSKYQDDVTGYVYYGYRWYDPSTGRWLNRDPLEEIAGPNLFAFCSNDPIDFIDPQGLVTVEVRGFSVDLTGDSGTYTLQLPRSGWWNWKAPLGLLSSEGSGSVKFKYEKVKLSKTDCTDYKSGSTVSSGGDLTFKGLSAKDVGLNFDYSYKAHNDRASSTIKGEITFGLIESSGAFSVETDGRARKYVNGEKCGCYVSGTGGLSITHNSGSNEISEFDVS